MNHIINRIAPGVPAFRNRLAAVFLTGLCSLLPGMLRAQCLLDNPSFELTGTAGAPFGGWNTFGSVEPADSASHGARAVRAAGQDTGDWNLSGVWQALACAPGDRWSVTGRVRASAEQPLTGGSQAVLNLEWRDAADGLIGYESFVIADAATSAGDYREFAVQGPPAPAGTVAVRVVAGVLQGPGEPVPAADVDQLTADSDAPPDLEALQWNDFPGGRTLEFADRTWRVKGPGWYGPGPNLFSDAPECVWVDGEDRLHLTIRHLAQGWNSTEVTLEEALGYGDYIFTTQGPLDLLDVHTVLGLFLWQYSTCYDGADSWWNPASEIDVEYSRWGNPGNAIGQFVAQPWDWAGNLVRYDAVFGSQELASHAFEWLPDRVEFRSWRGGPEDEAPETLIHQWTYTGPHLPRPEQPRVHLNLWQAGGPPALDQEVMLAGFTFVPMDGQTAVPPRPRDTTLPEGTAIRMLPASPNPFNPSTTIRFELARPGVTEIRVFNLQGACVGTLHQGPLAAGVHERVWDGHAESGAPAPSGLYFCRVAQGRQQEVQRLILLN